MKQIGWLGVALGMFAIAYGANSFAPMLLAYRIESHLSESVVTFLLAAYVLGLIPSLLISGPLSDKVGRRTLMRPALLTSAFSSLIFILAGLTHGTAHVALLVAGRLVCGVAVGLMMASGAAWLREISTASASTSAKRATIATSAGFGLGPLFSGACAQWLPGSLLAPWIVHFLVIVTVIVVAWRLPETVKPSASRRSGLLPASAFSARFLWTVAAWAPWAFGCATTSFATLASLTSGNIDHKIAYSGAIAALTMLTGVLVQPFATRLGRGFVPPAVVGLLLALVGMLLAWQIARTGSPAWLIPGAIFLGASYGIMMVSGLREVEVLAPRAELGALIAVFYSLTYVGFFAPFVLSFAGPRFGYPNVFLFGAVVIVLSIFPVTYVIKKYEPRSGSSDPAKA